MIPNQQQANNLRRHHGDTDSAEQFIKQHWPVPTIQSETLGINSVITYAVSTTLNSSVLLIASDSGHSIFTRNTHSADPNNPWLIFQHGKENRALAEHIQQQWNNMVIDPNGNREEVNRIAKHILYRKDADNNWVLVPPNVDAKNVVRFEAGDQPGDMVIWSHPPREKALLKVLRENEQFRRIEGDLKHFCDQWTNVVNNATIPEDKKPNALEGQRVKIKKKFLEMYGFYQKLEEEGLPNSYLWPTLQLGSRRADGTLQRYGGTFAGVYGTFTNQVHHKFHAAGVTARPLPTVETVYGWFTLSMQQFNMSFEAMIA